MFKYLLIFVLLVVASIVVAAPHDEYPSFANSEGRISRESNNFSISDDIIFKTVYFSVDGSPWQSFNLSSSGESYDEWFFSSGSVSVQDDFDVPGNYYFAVYSCSLVSDSWDCHGDMWQLFDFVVEESESVVGPYQVSTDYGLVNVTASDYDDSYNASPNKTLDNNLSIESRWSAEGEQWIQYDFDQVQSFDALNIFFYRGDVRRTNITIQSSSDGQSWQTAFQGESSGTTSGFESFSFSARNSKHIRILGHGNSDNDWNSIVEVELVLTDGCTEGETRNVSCSPSDPNAESGEQSQICQDQNWVDDGSCTITSCDSGYVLEDSQCVLEDSGEVSSYEDLLCPTGYYTNGSPCEELAFPTAEGYGRYAKGGRGGQIIKVTSLDESGSGTLKNALESYSGPRIVVFDVGGEIEITEPLDIKDGYVTVAGQTAPGDGITIRGSGFNIEDAQVIMRHVRVRPGDDYVYSVSPDAINVAGYSQDHNLSNLIFDHLSLSWGIDEVFSTWPRDAIQGGVTLQNSFIYEGLRYNNHDQGGSHSRGVLIGTGTESVSVINNLLAHNRRRSPLINPDTSDIDFINNVVYNWGEYKLGAAMHVYTPITGINVMNNYYKTGPDTTHGPGGCSEPFNYPSDDCNEPIYGVQSFLTLDNLPSDIAIFDNVYDDGSGPRDAREASFCFNEPECADYYWGVDGFDLRDTPLRRPEGLKNISSAEDVYGNVLANAGAIVPIRDPIDERVVNEVQSGTGQIIDSPNPLPARALPFATKGTNFFTGSGNMEDGHDWSGSNSDSFTVDGYTVDLDQDCTNQGSSEANVQCVIDMINDDLPSNLIAYNPTNYTNLYRVGIKTEGVGSSQSLTVSGSAVYDYFWISEGTYHGFDGVENTDGSIGYAPIANEDAPVDSDGDGMPDYWEERHCLNLSSDDSADYDLSAVYTNIEVYINDLAGDFGDELESQCS